MCVCVCVCQIPETMWRAAKTEDSGVVVAVAESWDWINYLVENDTVDYNYRCHEVDSVCAEEISYYLQQEFKDPYSKNL